MRKTTLSLGIGVAILAPGLVAGLAKAAPESAPAAKKPLAKAPKPAVAPARAAASAKAAAEAGPVDFDRDVRPIISENCFACHGFDAGKRQAGLRLDTAEGAYAKLASGNVAVVPGKMKESALVERVTGHTMPPPDFRKKLTEAQIHTLQRWVAQGGKYAPHWSFVAPKRPALPAVRNQQWVRNPIDQFVLAKLEKEGLKPSPEADRFTLIRRVTLDLTGIPPTPAEVDAFVHDVQPGAYERLVERLLAKPQYGERMALQWLDVARYADTHGYHIDSHRDMWPWRDWVIRAYNENKPYDQFVVEQLAGDLLPNPTRDQKIATGFNRNHPINFEGGAIPDEYHAAYIFDRIDTTSTVFMGLTMRCCQCHDHKYDPLTQKDFYRFYAFFNNVPEAGLDGYKGNAVPFMRIPSAEQETKVKTLEARITQLDDAAKQRVKLASSNMPTWEAGAENAEPQAAVEGLAAHYALGEGGAHSLLDGPDGKIVGNAARADGRNGSALQFDGSSYVDLGSSLAFDRTDQVSYGGWVYPTSNDAGAVLSRMDDADQNRGWDLYLQGGRAFVHLINQWDKNAIRVDTKNAMALNQWHHVLVTYDGSSKAQGVHVYVDGKAQELNVTHNALTGTIRTEKAARIGGRTPGALFKGRIQDVRFYHRELSSADVEELYRWDGVRTILTTDRAKRTPAQQTELEGYFLSRFDEPYRKLTADLEVARKEKTAVEAAIPNTMVMQEMDKPRDTFMLLRGEYDKKGDKVTAGVPAVLPAIPAGLPANRLGLAKWLVDPSHPLTARVAVNRYWQLYFGEGLVRTSENFGLQGERPTDPELLDWLATEFIRTGWDVKGMQRLIVTSATYRQSSAVAPAMEQRDPENRLLARGPRFRMPAEMIRDQALAVSGLLVPKIGGPSVRPYQPAGLWEEIAFGGNFTAQKYVQDHGDALYRRSMYTFWKRTCPPPALQAFDAPEREFCMVRRSVTNTPLQALVLMNDPTYVEASRKLAERIRTEIAATPPDRVRYAYRLVLGRPATGDEVRVLTSVYEAQLAKFQKDEAGAKKLLSVGESPRNERIDQAELAAWTNVCNVILNLDEVITKN